MRVDSRSIGRWKRAADFLSLALLYSSRYPIENNRLEPQARPFAAGHWGCVPGLNAIWANLVYFRLVATTRDIVPVLGTGHGGAAWLSWTILQDDLEIPATTAEELTKIFEGFGNPASPSYMPTELFADMPGLLWPTGEIGHALAVAQGMSLGSEERFQPVAIVGDGEFETGETLSALLGGSSWRAVERPLVIVNCNNFRMGGPSQLARLPHGPGQMLRGMGYAVSEVAEGDWLAFQRALNARSRDAGVILYWNRKGGDIPRLGDRALVDPTAVHKLPVKSISSPVEIEWLTNWLGALLSDDGVFQEGGIDRAQLGLPRNSLNLSFLESKSPADVNRPRQVLPSSSIGTGESAVERFVAAAEAHGRNKLCIFSPDEAASNRVQSAARIVEMLSERVTLGWAIGYTLTNAPAIHVSYEGFASTMLSMCWQWSQALRALTVSGRDAVGRLVVLITSPSWRNVESHQDSHFMDDLSRRAVASIEYVVPPTAALAAEAASLILGDDGDAAIKIVAAEKVLAARQHDLERFDLPDRILLFRHAGAPRRGKKILLVTLGEAMFNEAVAVVQYLEEATPAVQCDVVTPWWFSAGDAVFANQASRLVDLAASYDAIVCTSLAPMLPWTAIVQGLEATGKVVHSAVYKATRGSNEVARLRSRELDWLSTICPILRELGKVDQAESLSRIASRLDAEVGASTVSPKWYHTEHPRDIIRRFSASSAE